MESRKAWSASAWMRSSWCNSSGGRRPDTNRCDGAWHRCCAAPTAIVGGVLQPHGQLVGEERAHAVAEDGERLPIGALELLDGGQNRRQDVSHRAGRQFARRRPGPRIPTGEHHDLDLDVARQALRPQAVRGRAATGEGQAVQPAPGGARGSESDQQGACSGSGITVGSRASPRPGRSDAGAIDDLAHAAHVTSIASCPARPVRPSARTMWHT